jgi:hypothetical protein
MLGFVRRERDIAVRDRDGSAEAAGQRGVHQEEAHRHLAHLPGALDPIALKGCEIVTISDGARIDQAPPAERGHEPRQVGGSVPAIGNPRKAMSSLLGRKDDTPLRCWYGPQK